MLSLIMNGRLAVLGLIVTVANTYILSLAAISIFCCSVVAIPLIFILKEDAEPPINFTFDNSNFWSLLLKILKERVSDPALVKTVSNFILSVLREILAKGLVIKDSFLQEKNNNKMIVDTIICRIFFIKNKSTINFATELLISLNSIFLAACIAKIKRSTGN